MPDQAIHKKWQEHGWFVDKRRDHDICPQCLEKEKVRNKVVEMTPKNNAAANLNKAPVAEGYREPSREERRIIHDALAEVYRKDGKGYENGHSDQTVASDLGIPRKWVEEVRSLLFGDNAGNEDVAGAVAEFEQLAKDCKFAIAEGRKLTDAYAGYSKSMAALQQSLASINDRLVRLERKTDDLRKLLP